jgi:hypothetical protein
MNTYHTKFLELTNLYKEKEIKTNETKALDKLISEIGNEIKVIDSHFLKTEDIAPFLDELESNAKELDIKGEVVSVDSLTTDQGLYLNIKAEGTFDNLYKFLKLLENYKYELQIVDVKLVKGPSSLSEDGAISIPDWSAYIKIKIISLIN